MYKSPEGVENMAHLRTGREANKATKTQRPRMRTETQARVKSCRVCGSWQGFCLHSEVEEALKGLGKITLMQDGAPIGKGQRWFRRSI